MFPKIQPMDIGIVSGGPGYPWYTWPTHKLIQWRSIGENAVHTITFKNEDGDIWNPVFSGVESNHISMYIGHHITIHRYNKPMDMNHLLEWCQRTQNESEGYDFLKQWLMGFVLGIAAKEIADDPKKWTCAEFPYWAFQENGYKLTSKEEVLPLPRLFRYHEDFDVVYDGIVKL